MMELFALVMLFAALGFAAWTGLFGVHARTTARRFMRSGRARRQEREMVEVMRRKIAREKT